MWFLAALFCFGTKMGGKAFCIPVLLLQLLPFLALFISIKNIKSPLAVSTN